MCLLLSIKDTVPKYPLFGLTSENVEPPFSDDSQRGKVYISKPEREEMLLKRTVNSKNN